MKFLKTFIIYFVFNLSLCQITPYKAPLTKSIDIKNIVFYDIENIELNYSPPREILKCFGGYMNIKEFREKSNNNNYSFKKSYVPITLLIPQLEETEIIGILILFPSLIK